MEYIVKLKNKKESLVLQFVVFQNGGKWYDETTDYAILAEPFLRINTDDSPILSWPNLTLQDERKDSAISLQRAVSLISGQMRYND